MKGQSQILFATSVFLVLLCVAPIGAQEKTEKKHDSVNRSTSVALYQTALDQHKKGKDDAAMDLLKQALKNWPGNKKATYLFAEIAYDKGDKQSAAKLYRYYLQITSEEEKTSKRVMAELRLKKLEKEQGKLGQIKKMEKEFLESASKLRKKYERAGMEEKAAVLSKLEKAIKEREPAKQKTAETETAQSPKDQSSYPQGKTVSLRLGPGVSMKLVRIPAGTFVMGSEEGQADEQPRHRVKITKSFYMGMTEVTQAQWEAIMGTTPWEGKKHTPDSKNGPATFVSWKDAMMFCRKLSRRTGKKFRLPTEAEWEYACRAGTQTAYSFGDDPELLGKYGWFGKNSDRKPHAVAQKKPNPAGLYDMHGNVWELCLDYYAEDYYKNSPSADPKGPKEKGKRVKRGGSWRKGASLCRSASRYYFNRAYPDNFRTGGFRVVVTQNE